MKHKLFTFLLAIMASVSSLFAQSGTCGDNLTWNLTDSTLTITGSGEMAYGTAHWDVPWYNYNSYIKYVSLPDGLTSIGVYAFQSCRSLTSVTIPNSVTSIGDLAFCHCDSLTSLTIGNSVTSIGQQAFSGCTSLTSVTMGNSVTSIGAYAFGYCRGLTSIEIPNSVTSIENDAFIDCTGLTSVTWNVINYSVFSFTGPFTSSGSQITSFTFGDAVEYIPAYLCKGMNKLNTVTIPNSVTSIGKEAFYNCTGLTSLTIPNSVTSIGSEAFYNVSNIVYSGTATGSPWDARSVNGYVDDYLVYRDATKTTLLACYNSAQGETLIPNSVTIIGNAAFCDCSDLTSVIIPNSVTNIEGSAFYNCTGLTSMTIPNSVTSIGWWVFGYCAGLTTVTIPNSVTSIGNKAFSYCNNLTSITNQATTPQAINTNVFTNVNLSACTLYVPVQSLAAYQAADVWKEFGNILPIEDTPEPCIIASGTCGENLTWELSCDSVLTISGTGAMANISSASDIPWYEYRDAIRSIVISNGVTSIEQGAFGTCSNLTSVTIPNSVTSIGDEVFSGCSALSSVTNYATTPQTIDEYVFDGVNISSCTLHVPAGSRANYQTADVWKEFGRIVPITTEDVDITATTITASSTTADIKWPKVIGAETYTLEIKKNGELICTLTFDEEGHLISMSFAAPSRNYTSQQTQVAGFSFTITGLESGTTYNYTMTVKDNNGNVLKTESGTFTTIGAEGIEDAQSDQVQSTKILRNGQIFIQRGEKIYTITGQEIQSY